MQEFYSHGKLLISGEYLVLAGAKALAVPLKLGQYMRVFKSTENSILWNAIYKGKIWFTAQFSFTLEIISTSDEERATYVQQLLRLLKSLAPDPNLFSEPLLFEHILEFDPFWGLGSSSTLINNLATWAQIDAFELLAAVSKGSGYDIACTKAERPIFFQKVHNKNNIEKAPFHPDFHHLLHFVFLEKKQNSESSILQYVSDLDSHKKEIDEISHITDELCKTKDPDYFVHLMELHEKIIASVIHQQTTKETLFSDYTGNIKSLGAWGGDFILAINTHGDKKDKEYFQQKGFQVYLNYKDLVI